jgi:hypothetical protein
MFSSPGGRQSAAISHSRNGETITKSNTNSILDVKSQIALKSWPSWVAARAETMGALVFASHPIASLAAAWGSNTMSDSHSRRP